MESLLYVLRSIAALVVVIWLANVALKYINKYTNNQTRTIQIVERLSVSKASSLAIVKIVNDYYLMSFSEKSSEILQQFSPEEVKVIEERLREKEHNDFSEAIKKIDLSGIKEKYTEFFERSN